MVALPTNLFSTHFTTTDVNYVISLPAILLFLVIYATTPALLQIGKRFQTGYTAPVIDQNHNTMSGSPATKSKARDRTANDNEGLRSFAGNQQIVSSISAHDRIERENYRSHSERPRRDRSVKKVPAGGGGVGEDGASMASDSSQKIIISKTVTQSSTNI